MKKVFEDLLKNIPDYKVFLTTDEMDASSRKLAEDYPDVVSIFEMGKTREGDPLLCLKIGNGSKNALMFGCPHPNEPIGTMMLEYLTRELASNAELRAEYDYTLYVVKSWDRDGTKLNENWFKGPYTIYNYTRNFFRPAGHKQVDWTFPIDYKDLHFHEPIPETEAMMKLITDIRPSFIYSLHNAGFGGAYWYMTRPTAKIYDKIRETAIKQDVPLNLGEPEAPYCIAYSPAIYQSLGIRENYDYLEKYGAKNIQDIIKVGTCSADFANQLCDAFTLLTELPYFYDERIKDLSQGRKTREECVLENLEFSEKASKTTREILGLSALYMDKENPFKLAVEAFTKEDNSNDATRKMVAENPDFKKTATVAEEFDNALVSKFYKNLSFGLLLRANEQELEIMKKTGEKNPQKEEMLKKAMGLAEKQLKDLSEYLEKNINYQVVPIKKLVAVQLEAGLLVSEYLKKEKQAQ